MVDLKVSKVIEIVGENSTMLRKRACVHRLSAQMTTLNIDVLEMLSLTCRHAP